VTTWDGETAPALARRLNVPRVELRDEVESTQDVAHDLASQGAAAGTVVLADAQRAGRGRMGRSWSSAPGQGVWCTIVERPGDARALDVLSIRIGLQLAEALDRCAPSPVQVKWPNDLLVGGQKLGGILAEARWTGAVLGWVAIGVGVNVMRPAVAGAAGLAAGVRRADVLAAAVSAVRAAAASVGWLTPSELTRYASRDALLRRSITSPTHGIVAGVAESGALIVEGPNGPEQHRSGTIQLAEAS
jgi:BirA family biotin operon repressor/biotin-[acetyl-CoA-carboxylase] ligase